MAVTPPKKVVPNLSLKETLQEKEQLYHGKDDIFGMTLLTNPGYISASRNIMFTSHLRQFVNLNKPDFPKVLTNYENLVGKHSTGYFKPKNDLIVVDKIPKFNDINDANHLYLLFLYDKKTNTYSVIQKKIVEDLTEKFGFKYKNDLMDSKSIGDKIQGGKTLYSSTSYDEDDNYNYGRNIKFMYLLENNTIEDAIKCSESLSKEMTSTEVETVKISFNDNEIMCNLYGNNDEYKGFPDINERVKDKIICAKRRIHNNQLLFDLKKSNLRKINFMSDNLFFIDGKIVDITIYSNKPIGEIEDNIFNHQMLKYLKMQKEFYTKVLDRCKKIIASGAKYSNEINFYYKKAKNILDDNYMYKEEDNSVFSNMVIEFLVEREVPLSVGQKITGRYGNIIAVFSLIVGDILIA